jgi:hypothetical protein
MPKTPLIEVERSTEVNAAMRGYLPAQEAYYSHRHARRYERDAAAHTYAHPASQTPPDEPAKEPALQRYVELATPNED